MDILLVGCCLSDLIKIVGRVGIMDEQMERFIRPFGKYSPDSKMRFTEEILQHLIFSNFRESRRRSDLAVAGTQEIAEYKTHLGLATFSSLRK
jgi:hypothetical protein